MIECSHSLLERAAIILMAKAIREYLQEDKSERAEVLGYKIEAIIVGLSSRTSEAHSESDTADNKAS